HAVTDVLGHLERQGLLVAGDLGVDQEGVVDLGHLIGRELDVEHRSDDPGDATGHGGRVGGGLFDGCSHWCLPQSDWAASASALAPPTISLISWVMPAWRAWFASRVYFWMSSSALSVADFIAFWRAASSEAAACSRQE